MAGDNLGVGFRYEDIRDLCQKAVIGEPGARPEDTSNNAALNTAVTGSGAGNEFRKKKKYFPFCMSTLRCLLLMVLL